MRYLQQFSVTFHVLPTAIYAHLTNHCSNNIFCARTVQETTLSDI